MNILTPSQFKVLIFAWKTKGFAISEAHESGFFEDVTPETIRTTTKRVCEKGFMEEVKEKGSPPRFYSKTSKQDYYIMLAREWFKGASEEDKKFFKWAIDQV
jgi:predicted transcriptional regulator